MAVRGTRLRLIKINFSPFSIMITEPLDTSLPVPEVVGIATSGATSPIFSTPPKPAV